MQTREWHYIPLLVGKHEVGEICAKLVLDYSRLLGWHLSQVIIDGETPVRCDGTGDDQSAAEQAVADAANAYFAQRGDDIRAELGLLERSA